MKRLILSLLLAGLVVLSCGDLFIDKIEETGAAPGGNGGEFDFSKCDGTSEDACVIAGCAFKTAYDACVTAGTEEACAYILTCAKAYVGCICPDGSMLTDATALTTCTTTYTECVTPAATCVDDDCDGIQLCDTDTDACSNDVLIICDDTYTNMYNEDCPGATEFSTAAYGECAAVPCTEDADCVDLGVCDDPEKTSTKTFNCNADDECARD